MCVCVCVCGCVCAHAYVDACSHVQGSVHIQACMYMYEQIIKCPSFDFGHVCLLTYFFIATYRCCVSMRLRSHWTNIQVNHGCGLQSLLFFFLHNLIVVLSICA